MKHILTFYGLILGILLMSPSTAYANKISVSNTETSGSFPLVTPSSTSELAVDAADAEVVSIVAKALSGDIKLITGVEPSVSNTIQGNSPVIIGTLGQSLLIDSLVKSGKISTDNIEDEWETFCITVVEDPFNDVDQALVIYGSDPRGTAFGVFEFSKLMGVSPWVWWADVLPEEQTSLYVTPGESIYGPPSIQFRGIFLNDEDWGLQPWAAEKIDTDIKDIGPKTYAKIFELMLRCKANYIWPAMHPSTKAFWYYKGNPEMAKKYEIVLGSSHAEPMLRNNVDEWKNNFLEEYGYAPGEFNWATNRSQVEMYWTDRANESKNNDALYTVGMRGIHDSKMVGYNSDAERAAATKEVINVQRSILGTAHNKDASQVPQVFCPYKEALKLYRIGLDLADDITLLWVDDNYGYIRQLSNPTEQLRSGGSGVYYHFSYWGWPEDYLWVSTISPSLASYELMKAYELNAKKAWIVNVGDIKPNEMEMQFALDLAWDVTTWTPEKAHLYPAHWAAETFGNEFGESIGKIKEKFYQLAATGKPEQLHKISFKEQEMLYRISAYDSLVVECDKLKAQMPARLQDAFFQLIEYPVKGTASMNVKNLAARLSHSYAGQGKEEALAMSSRAVAAFDKIVSLTHTYNNDIADGKWNKMMDYAPRGLIHFYGPNVASVVAQTDIPPAKEDSVTLIAASQYSGINGNGHSLQTIRGLGSEGSAVAVLPLNMKSYSSSNVTTAPYTEYDVPVKKGVNKITVRCLPNFPIYEEKQLRFALSIDDSTPEFFNIETEAEKSAWATNILRGYAHGVKNYASTADKTIKVRIYFTDPGLVLSGITTAGVTETEYTAMLSNPNFELKAQGQYNDGTTVRGIPYGWISEGNLGGNSFGINADGTNLSGSNLCWINSSPMPNNYELYQLIDSLPAGEYIVRCRLAVMSARVTNQRLFANNKVQYFANEANYASNQTVGEINSFAGYTPGGYTLKEMAVKIAVFEGDSLKLGIRSSNKKGDGSNATNNSGWFKVDHFRIELLRSFDQVSGERNKLDSLITVAIKLYDSTKAGTETGQYRVDKRTALHTSIQMAESIDEKPDANLEEILNEIANLSQAIEDYRNAVLTWNRFLVNPDFEYKAMDVLNDGSTVRGIPYGWSTKGTLIGKSFGINNDGVGYNGNNLCWINSSPMPQEFELYQSIEDLPAGKYTVRCRLAVMSNRVTNQRLFGNKNVQYFGEESSYTSNLTNGENNTFAAWTPTASYLLKEMEVSVHLAEGEPLNIGIRSGNTFADGSSASDNSGWFKVDHFSLELDSLHTSSSKVNIQHAHVIISKQKGGFAISIDQSFNQGKLWLYSINGHLVMQDNLNSTYSAVSISQPGIYIAKVVIDGNVTTSKIACL